MTTAPPEQRSSSAADENERFESLLRQVAHEPEIDPRATERVLVGSKLGTYRVDARIGSGGMGVVYRATDERLGRRVALKVLRARYARDEALRALLVREARAAASVNHPNVAAVYGLDLDGDRAFIAMELVEGRPLRDVTRAGGLPWRLALRYARAIASGLARAHRAGVIHRDLKPDNVIVDADGNPKILDFGLARVAHDPAADDEPARDGRARTATTGAGTRGYMPPEQAAGVESDARADVYAFGMTLRELLTGAPPLERAKKIRAPRALVRIVDKATAAVPAARYANGEELARALSEVDARDRAVRAARKIVLACAASIVLAAAAAWAMSALPSRPMRRADGPAPARAAPTRPRSPRTTPLTSLALEASVLDVAISHDGARIAYVEPRGVFVMELDHGRAERVDVPIEHPDCASWLPDGERLVVRGDDGNGGSAVWLVAAKSALAAAATPRRLPIATADCPRVSPDGRRVAFASERSLHVVELGDGAERIVPIGPGQSTWSVTWSPTGRQVALVRYTDSGGDAIGSLDVIDLASSRAYRVEQSLRLFLGTGEAALTWLRDGRLVYALAPLEGTNETELLAVTVSADTGEPGRAARIASLADMTPGRMSAAFGADRIAFTKHDVQVDIDIGELDRRGTHLSPLRRVTMSERNEWPNDWSTDGRAVLGHANARGRYELTMFDVATGLSTPLAGGIVESTYPIAVPGSAAMLYFEHAAGRASLVASESGRRRVLTTVDDRGPSSLTAAPSWARARCPRTARATAMHGCVLGESAPFQLRLTHVDVARSEVRPLCRIDLPALLSPRWALSPDGVEVAITGLGSGAIDLFRVTGEQVRHIPLDRQLDLVPQALAWRPDGRALFLTGARMSGREVYRIVLVELSGRQRLLWATDSRWLTMPAVSPDGQRLAVAAVAYDADAWLLEGLSP